MRCCVPYKQHIFGEVIRHFEINNTMTLTELPGYNHYQYREVSRVSWYQNPKGQAALIGPITRTEWHSGLVLG